MAMSLYSKLAAVLACLFCLVGGVFIIVVLISSDMYQQEVNQRLNRDLAGHILANRLLIRGEDVDRKALGEVFDMLMVVNPGIEVYLLDPEGKILAYSAPEGKVWRDRVDLKPVREWLAGGDRAPLAGDDPRDPTGEKVFTVAPILEKGTLKGYLYVILGGEAYDSVVHTIRTSYILQWSAWIIAAALLFALAAGLVSFGLLTRRLRRLTAAMEDFARRGDMDGGLLSPKPTGGVGDEIDRLASVFDAMSGRIENQMEELRHTDSLRRELTANVSHDLRTPLATLRGYVETLLLKDEVLTTEERKEYLQAAVRYCERLGGLVAELLELAKLDAGAIAPQWERFNLGELVQDVLQKMRPRAGERDVQLIADSAQEAAFVAADIAMIERVLENLVENALRHTPSGGTVRVAVRREGEGLGVEVSDTGPGISQEALPHIFERFYRQGGDGEGHSGLGLAISKRILELHGESIQAVGIPGGGAVFRFGLPLTAPDEQAGLSGG
jgi:two-component system, OmpR family, sensor kinase